MAQYGKTDYWEERYTRLVTIISINFSIFRDP